MQKHKDQARAMGWQSTKKLLARFHDVFVSHSEVKTAKEVPTF
jgi:hypothetical protein